MPQTEKPPRPNSVIAVRHFNLCLLGFGHVGQALVCLLAAKPAEMRERYGVWWRITGVISLTR